MKRRRVEKVGNFFIGLGLVVMISGGGYSILAEVSQFNLPPPALRVGCHYEHFYRRVDMGIGLVGARIGRREQLA